MNNQQHGNYQGIIDNGDFSQKQLVGTHWPEMKKEIAEP